MITEEELSRKIENMRVLCFSAVSYTPQAQQRTLEQVMDIIKVASRDQLLAYDPSLLVMCTLKLLLYYNEFLFSTDYICEWKRRKKLRLAKECYYNLLRTYIPERSKEIVEAVINVIYRDKLWEFETFSFEIMCNLLEYGASGAVMSHVVWNKVESPNVDIEDTRGIIRIMYELLDIYSWPETHDTVLVIERTLNLFYVSITTSQSLNNASASYAMLKRGLEVCIRNTVKHLSNDHLLIVIQHMCSWAVEEGITDDMVLDFGSTLEYTAFMHQVTLYENTLTPKIFPLLMDMIASRSKIISLLGNRVLQYLLDRKENRINFDTPRIFFEDTHFDLKLDQCFKEDKLFCKLHREILHDSLLRSIINHSGSRMNLETTYCTICLLAIEVPCGFTAAALVCLAMNLQELTLHSREDHKEIAYHKHATVIAIISLICWIHKAKVFYEYVNKIMMERAHWAPHLNPPIQSEYSFAIHHVLWDRPDLFFIDWEARYGLWKCFRLHASTDTTSMLT